MNFVLASVFFLNPFPFFAALSLLLLSSPSLIRASVSLLLLRSKMQPRRGSGHICLFGRLGVKKLGLIQNPFPLPFMISDFPYNNSTPKLPTFFPGSIVRFLNPVLSQVCGWVASVNSSYSRTSVLPPAVFLSRLLVRLLSVPRKTFLSPSPFPSPAVPPITIK